MWGDRLAGACVWRLCLLGSGENRINLVHWNIITHFKALKHIFICWRNGNSHTLLTWNTSVTKTYHLKVSNTFSKFNHTVNQNTKSFTLTPTSFLKETCSVFCDCQLILYFHIPAELVQYSCPYFPYSPWQKPNPARSNHERPISVYPHLGIVHYRVRQPFWCLTSMMPTVHRRFSGCVMADGGLGMAVRFSHCTTIRHSHSSLTYHAHRRVAVFVNLIDRYCISKTLTMQTIAIGCLILNYRVCLRSPREI